MSDERAPRHEWPDDEPQVDEVPKPTRGRLARLIGGMGMTIGMAQGLAGGRSGDGQRAIANRMAVDEAERQAKR